SFAGQKLYLPLVAKNSALASSPLAAAPSGIAPIIIAPHGDGSLLMTSPGDYGYRKESQPNQTGAITVDAAVQGTCPTPAQRPLAAAAPLPLTNPAQAVCTLAPTAPVT